MPPKSEVSTADQQLKDQIIQLDNQARQINHKVVPIPKKRQSTTPPLPKVGIYYTKSRGFQIKDVIDKKNKTFLTSKKNDIKALIRMNLIDVEDLVDTGAE